MNAGSVDIRGVISMLGDMRPFESLDEQVRATLAALRDVFPFERWEVSRLIDGGLVTAYVAPETEALTSYPWADTICGAMVASKGPSVVPSIAAVQAYKATGECRERGIGAWAGTPLSDGDGSLWGALCATHPTALETDPIVDVGFLRWVARSMSTRLGLTGVTARRDPTRRQGSGMVLDLDVWTTVLEKEHERARRTGVTGCLIEIDIDIDLDKEAAKVASSSIDIVDRAAQVLAIAARGCDYVARTGPRCVGLVAVNCSSKDADIVMDRLVGELDDAGIAATAAMVDLLPRGGSSGPVPVVELPAVITYSVCELCQRKGAYVSPRFAVLRCKYCGARQQLSDAEWRAALDSSR